MQMEEAPRLEAPRRTGRRAGLTGAPGVSGEGPAVLRPSCPGQPRTGLSLSGLSGMQCLGVSGPFRDPEFLLSPSEVFPEVTSFWG